MNDALFRETLLPGERLDDVNEQLRLIQKNDGLTFGTDAYLLAAFIRPSHRAKAVELGSGTGIISLLITARNKVTNTVAVELQPEYALLCERNVRLNGFSDRIEALCADVRTLSPTSIGYEADIVFSNPPYMRTDTGLPNTDAGRNAARHETAGGIADFCAAAARLLKHGGLFYTVYRPDRLAEMMAGLKESRLEPKRMTFVYADTASAPSIVLCESRKGGAPGLSVTPPLILYRAPHDGGRREMTPEAEAVYETCSLYPARNSKKKHTENDASNNEAKQEHPKKTRSKPQ